jgi:hypothetical protein
MLFPAGNVQLLKILSFSIAFAAPRLIETCLQVLRSVNPLPVTIHGRVMRLSFDKGEECLLRGSTA